MAVKMQREKKEKKAQKLKEAAEAEAKAATKPVEAKAVSKPAEGSKAASSADQPRKSASDAKGKGSKRSTVRSLPSSRKSRNFEKTRICAHYLRNRCNYPGNLCNFAHTTAELTLGPITPDMKCELWAHGLCDDPNCPLQHNDDAPLPFPNANYKDKTTCKFWSESGSCKFEEQCRHVHHTKTSPKHREVPSLTLPSGRSTVKLLSPSLMAEVHTCSWATMMDDSDQEDSGSDKRSWYDKTFSCETDSTASTDGLNATNSRTQSPTLSPSEATMFPRPLEDGKIEMKTGTVGSGQMQNAAEEPHAVVEVIDEYGNHVFVSNQPDVPQFGTNADEFGANDAMYPTQPEFFYGSCGAQQVQQPGSYTDNGGIDCVVRGVQLGAFSCEDLFLRMPVIYED